MSHRRAHRGLPQWLAQRATALFLALYSVFALGIALVAPPISFDAWKGLFENAWAKLATSLFALSLAWHAAIGIHDMLRDYVRPELARRVLLAVGHLVLVLFVIQVLQTLWR